ncbi:unnamed protein product, partial [Ceratitis capitata]
MIEFTISQNSIYKNVPTGDPLYDLTYQLARLLTKLRELTIIISLLRLLYDFSSQFHVNFV